MVRAVTASLREQLADIATRCDNPIKESADQWSARCPAHNDRSPSLRIGAGENGRPLVQCLTGCDYADVRAALIDRGVSASLLGPAPTTGAKRSSTAKPKARTQAKPLPSEEDVAGWHERLMKSPDLKSNRSYLRESRGLKKATLRRYQIGYERGRYVIPVRDEAGALVNLRRYDPKAAQAKMMNLSGHGENRLFPLEVLADADPSEPVLVVEGEWDALLAGQHGLIAVTGTGGASNVPKDLSALTDRSVYVLYDCDQSGREGAVKMATALLGVAKEAFVVDLGLGNEGEDVTDWFVRFKRTAEDLRALMDRARPFAGEGVGEDPEWDEVLGLVRAEFLADRDDDRHHLDDLHDDDGIAALEPVEYVVKDWVPRKHYTVIYGEPGIGKTLALLGMSRAARRGTRWQDNATKQGAVLYYQGEGLEQFQGRIHAWDTRYPLRNDQRMAPWGATDRVVALSTPEGVAAVVMTLRRFAVQSGEQVALVVIDPLVEYMAGDENGEGMQNVTCGLRALAKVANVAVVVGHHSNASGLRERGTMHLRMRAGSFARMERVDETSKQIGLLQEKHRFGPKYALVLEMRESAEDVILEWTDAMLADDYVAKRAGAEQKRTTERQRRKSEAARGDRQEAILDYLRDQANEGETSLTQGAVSKAVGGNHTAFKEALTALAAEGLVTVQERGVGRPNLVSLTERGAS